MMFPAVEVGRPEDSAPVVGVVIVGQRQTSVREQLPRLQPGKNLRTTQITQTKAFKIPHSRRSDRLIITKPDTNQSTE